MSDGISVILLIIIVAVLIIAGPLLIIGSINTLFNTGIEYTFWTWASALILGGLVSNKK